MSIRCYGLDWSFDAGMTGSVSGGEPVRLNAMHGIYVLYDRKGELSYVGRSGGKNYRTAGIYGRVYCHRVEEHKDFDRYSWFGTLPVSNGSVDVAATPAEGLISLKSLEAMLIYLLDKPKWNGDWGQFTHIPRYEQRDTRGT